MFSFFKLHKASVPSQTSDAILTQTHPDYPSLDGVYETSYPGCQSISKCVSCTGNGKSFTLTTSAGAYAKTHYISMTIDDDKVAVTYPTGVA